MRFSIVIPTFNNLEYLQLCIKSIRQNSKFEHEIIVHNNGQNEPSEDFIKTNKIIYSISLKKIISNVLKKDDHNTNIKSIRFINNNLNFFLNDMEIIIFDKKAQFKALKKLSKKPKSEIIFLNDKLYYLDKKKTLVVLN